MSRSRERGGDSPDAEWRLYAWSEFARQFTAMMDEVDALKRSDPAGYRSHRRVKLFATVLRLVRDVVPADPGADAFRQGNTLGPSHRHWLRVKFHERFRLFFRFHSSRRIIVYAWMNDEHSLRKSGARTDPYHVFRGMLERGAPPNDFDALLAESRRLIAPGEDLG